MRRALATGRLVFLAVLTLAFVLPAGPPPAIDAASHREAPLIALDPAADITDFFMFRSYETGRDDRVVLIMDVFPGGEPSSGPNYFAFDPGVLYSFNLDTDQGGIADVQIDVEFTTEVRGTVDAAGLFLDYVAVPGPITALDGAGSEGLGVRQTYKVTFRSKTSPPQSFLGDASGKPLFAVPSNVGPRTMPNYDALAAQGVFQLANGVRVFAGQRDDPFYIDLGAVFDTLNLRNPGTDMLSGFNVQTIALEIPASMITHDHLSISNTAHPRIGGYASTSRRTFTVLRDAQARFFDRATTGGPWVQVQRMANPLINEAIIGTEDKDKWNSVEPEDEVRFLDYYRNPRLGVALNLVFGAAVPATPRQDLVDLLLKYLPSDTRLSELLRLDLRTPPTALASQKALTVLASPPDPAGWPNGRRPIDDVTDIAIRVVGGTNYSTAGDSVNVNDRALPAVFPFLSSPHSGRNRFHTNP